jgi:hypothetical protein
LDEGLNLHEAIEAADILHAEWIRPPEIDVAPAPRPVVERTPVAVSS